MIPKKVKDLFFNEVTSFGGIFVLLAVIGILIISKNIILSLQLFVGIIILYIITVVIRSFYFKKRPENRKYTSFIGKLDASSFPSLHSARPLFFTLVIWSFYKDTYLLIFLLFLTLCASYSRIYLKKHYWSDVLGGWFFGVLTYFVVISII